MYTTKDGPKEIGLATLAFPKHAMPGDFVPDSLDKPLKPLAERVSEMKLPELADKKHRGDILGEGWDDNVAHALFTLKKLKQEGQFPDVINCVGWSRGAVTCLKLANAIHDYFVDGKPYRMPKELKHRHTDENMVVKYPALARGDLVSEASLKTNLFLIDPVPGRFGVSGENFGSSSKTEKLPPEEHDYQHVPRTVAKAIITLASDEQREGFAPLDASKVKVDDPARSIVVWLPFPGIHRTQLRMEPRDPADHAIRAKLTAVPHLVFDLAWRFLTENGTTFQRPVLADAKFGGRQLTNEEALGLYSDVWLHKLDYHHARNSGLQQAVQGGLAPRLFTGYPFLGRELHDLAAKHTRQNISTAELGVYVKFPGFFINEHHRALFEKTHPKLYAFLTHAPSGKRDEKLPVPADVIAELRLPVDATLVLVLKDLGWSQDGGKYYVAKTFRFGDELGDPLHEHRAPRPARFTGFMQQIGMIP
jgi:hypothetical protein